MPPALPPPTGVPHLPASGPLAGVLDAVAGGLAEHAASSGGRLMDSASPDRLAVRCRLCALLGPIPHDCAPLTLGAGLAA